MTRLISGLVLAGAALAAILLLPPFWLRLVVVLVAALAASEYLSITSRQRGPARWAIVALVALACWTTSATQVPDPLVMVAVTFAWLAWSLLWGNRPLQEAAAELAAAVYIGIPLGMLAAAHIVGGAEATLVLMGTVVVSDSAQYYTGRAFGRRPLAPAISPKKTVEGALGGVVFGVLFMAIAGRVVFPSHGWLARATLGAVVVALGIIGDLFESRLKRTAGMKDSSSLIPGHGGVLDRIDALLFAIPPFYAMVVRGA